MGTKKCTKCGPQPVSEFGKNASKPDGLKTECRVCAKAYFKTYYEDNKQKWAAADAAKRAADPEGFKAKNRAAGARHRASPTNTIRLRYLKRRYGISPADYEAMLARQGGVCAICGSRARGSDRRLHVDHCHATGKVRGLLCFSCNSGLGHFADRRDWLQAADAYLAAA